MSVFHNIYKSKLDEYYKTLEKKEQSEKFFLFQEFYSTVTGTFKWGNIPKANLYYQPEKYLFWWGQCAFFKDDNGEFKIFPCYPSGELLENGLYSKWVIIAENGKSWIKNYDEIEICFANTLHLPSCIATQEMVNKCTYALEAVDTGLRRAIASNIIDTDDESVMKMLTEYLKDSNTFPLFKLVQNGGFKTNLQLTKLFDNRENDVLALWDIFVRYRNMFLTSRGINNVEIQKKERLTQAEGGANDEFVRYSMLDSEWELRKDFEHRVLEHFNYNLEIELRRDRMTVYELELSNSEKVEAMEMENLKGVNLGNPNMESEVKENESENE